MVGGGIIDQKLILVQQTLNTTVMVGPVREQFSGWTGGKSLKDLGAGHAPQEEIS